MTYDPRLFGLTSSTIPATKLSASIKNMSGSTIPKLTPISVDSSGNMALIDVSIEASAMSIVGLTSANVLNSTYGEVFIGGQLVNISVSATFGDVMFVAKDGSLTNVKPSIGVGGFLAGDWIIRVGVIAKNDSNPLQKDMFIATQVIGQL